MSSGTLIFLLFVIGFPLAMMSMHRGGGAGMGCGGHGGHGGHGGDAGRGPVRGDEGRAQSDHPAHGPQPLLGAPAEPGAATKKGHGCH
jgi:hypothetical protein